MQENLKSVIIRIFACFMIGIIGVLIANNAIFIHSHRMADGTLITHAHPYNKTNDSEPFKSHHHTQAEFLFLENLEIYFLFVLLALVSVSFFGKKKFTVRIHDDYISANTFSHKGRAPPVV